VWSEIVMVDVDGCRQLLEMGASLEGIDPAGTGDHRVKPLPRDILFCFEFNNLPKPSRNYNRPIYMWVPI